MALVVSSVVDRRVAGFVVLVGIVSAFHVGKLPPAIPVLARDLGVTLVQGGFLLAVIQMAGMTLGALAGLVADRLGPRRVMLAGLLLLSLGSGWGSVAHSPQVLLLTRALEGLGFLLAVLPAPGLIRRQLQDASRLNKALGYWGAYMPVGAATMLLLGPIAYASMGWRAVWVVLAMLSLACAWGVWRWIPPDPSIEPGSTRLGLWPRLSLTLSSAGPWLVALGFLMYSGQWLAVVGFLPTIYTEAGWSPAWVGVLSALAAGVNLVGNIGAGRWLARGVRPQTLLFWGFGTMGAGAVLSFADLGLPGLQYAAVFAFSAVGGVIPGTLFALSVRLAPSAQTVSTTVGWVQQLSALGQFTGPPMVAWLAARVGGWHLTWAFNLGCCLAGMALAWLLQRRLAQAAH